MPKCYRSEIVCVFGCPVDENPTVIPQEAAFRELGLNYRYLNFEIKPDRLGDAFNAAKTLKFRGVNLTIPHKVAALEYMDGLSEAAQKIGAVNTVLIEEGRLYGDNTDGKGFMRSLAEDAGVDANGARVVILGAGGAARAIAVELASAGAQSVMIINRSRERGKGLCSLLSRNCGFIAKYAEWTPLVSIPPCDVLVNATSIGLFPDSSAPDINYDSIRPSTVVCDVIPNPPSTRFLAEAQKRGAATINGLSMLAYQAAIGFELWTGKSAPADVMLRALEAEFGVGQ